MSERETIDRLFADAEFCQLDDEIFEEVERIELQSLTLAEVAEELVPDLMHNEVRDKGGFKVPCCFHENSKDEETDTIKSSLYISYHFDSFHCWHCDAKNSGKMVEYKDGERKEVFRSFDFDKEEYYTMEQREKDLEDCDKVYIGAGYHFARNIAIKMLYAEDGNDGDFLEIAQNHGSNDFVDINDNVNQLGQLYNDPDVIDLTYELLRSVNNNLTEEEREKRVEKIMTNRLRMNENDKKYRKYANAKYKRSKGFISGAKYRRNKDKEEFKDSAVIKWVTTGAKPNILDFENKELPNARLLGRSYKDHFSIVGSIIVPMGRLKMWSDAFLTTGMISPDDVWQIHQIALTKDGEKPKDKNKKVLDKFKLGTAEINKETRKSNEAYFALDGSNRGELYICEGFADCLALNRVFNGLTIAPITTLNHQWKHAKAIVDFVHELSDTRLNTIYLCPDNDGSAEVNLDSFANQLRKFDNLLSVYVWKLPEEMRVKDNPDTKGTDPAEVLGLCGGNFDAAKRVFTDNFRLV